MMEWRTIQMAMPAQLNQVSQAMGKTTDQLGEDLRNGTVSMDDFIDTFIRLNKEGANGFESFEVQARNSTGGIKTSISTAKTAVVRGVADIISSINEALQSAGAGSIGEIITNIGKAFENTLKWVGDVVKEYLPPVVEYIAGIIDKIRNYIQNSNFEKTIENLKNIAQTVFKAILDSIKPIFNFIKDKLIPIVKKMFEWFKQKIDTVNIEKLTTVLKKLSPVLTGIITGFAAFKTFNFITTVATTITKSIQKIITAIKGLTMMPLAGWIGVAIAAITAIVVAIKSFSSESENSFKKAENAVQQSFEGINKAFTEYGQKIDSAKGYLDGFNTRLFQTEEEQQKLEDDLRDIQNSITEITSKASEERRSLTDAEIQKLDEYFEKLQELRQKQLEIQQAIGEAITTQALTDLQNFDGTLSEFSDKAAEWTKTSQEQMDNNIKLANDAATEEIAILNSKYTEEERLTSEAYKSEYNQIVERKNKNINEAKNEHQQILDSIQSRYDGEISLDKDAIEKLNDNVRQRKRLQSELDEAEEGFFVKGTIRRAEELLNRDKTKQEIERLDREITNTMDGETAKQIGIWAKNLEETKKNGGEISEENRQMAEDIINIYSKLDTETQKKMSDTMTALKNIVGDAATPTKKKAEEVADGIKNAFSGFGKAGSQAGSDLLNGVLAGIDNKSGTVYSRIFSVGSQMLATLKSSLKEASPSKASYQMAEYLMEGFDDGIVDSEKGVYRTLNNFGNEVLNKMSNAVTLETGKINAKAFLTSNVNRTIQVNAEFNGDVELDSRKVGRIIAPDVSRAIKVGGL